MGWDCASVAVFNGEGLLGAVRGAEMVELAAPGVLTTIVGGLGCVEAIVIGRGGK